MKLPDDGRIPTSLIVGGDLLTAIQLCVDLGVDMDPGGDRRGKVRRLGTLEGLPVYLDEFLEPGKVLVTYKQGGEDTPWIKMS